MFIVFEGIDGSGKSEHVKLLERALTTDGVSVSTVSTGDCRPIRELYRRLVSGENLFPTPLVSLFLALSDFADAIKTIEGRVVLAHRYVYSALADAIALGLCSEKVTPLMSFFPAPDLIIFVNTPPQCALGRKKTISLAEAGGPDFVNRHQDLRSAFLEFQGRVAEAYQSLLGSPGCPVAEIDGSRDLQESHGQLLAEVRLLLRQKFLHDGAGDDCGTLGSAIV